MRPKMDTVAEIPMVRISVAQPVGEVRGNRVLNLGEADLHGGSLGEGGPEHGAGDAKRQDP
jgi:hypothetical protein